VKDRKGIRADRFDDPPLPDLDGDEALADIFMAWGAVKVGAMGYVPLDWADLAHYRELAQYPLTPWQCETMIAMSRAYAVISNDDDPSLPMPYSDGIVARDDVGQRLKKALDALASRKRTGRG
jgi:hypothetical protein